MDTKVHMQLTFTHELMGAAVCFGLPASPSPLRSQPPFTIPSPPPPHFHLSSLCGLKAVLAVTVHFPVKEAFIAAGTGTLAHLLTTEGFGFTTPSPWATHF